MHVNAFRALSDPQRFGIVEALLAEELAVNDLVARTNIHQSGVSRHLRILGEAGFVQVRADGTRRLYSLKTDRFREIDDWLAGYRALWTTRLDAFERALRQKQLAQVRKPSRRKA